ncbi:DUF3613 domain-containing protein [Pusillimonas noertemannii]|uniref:DUF3613 domain-containing protein n=1 Tax=Pusillimonas noertemannii TaxID=305977 RepID=UPI0002E1E15B|nr:DUF3613 domain-containing protein [Pusillimonas noertemannii]
MNRLLLCLPLAALTAGLSMPALGQTTAPLTGRMAAPAASTPAVPPAGATQKPAPAGGPTLAGPPAEAYVISKAGQPPDNIHAPAAAASSPTAVVHTRRRVGDVTALLLAAQAEGRRAGPELPMLAPAANAAWKRYLDSYTHPIPEWFQERVEVSSP